MKKRKTLESDRIILRQWKDSDIPVFAELNADSEVMRYFPETRTEQQTRDMVSVVSAGINKTGWGFWAAELKKSGEFIGFVGLNAAPADLPFSPCVEVGWRLHRKYWGNGYATEAGKISLAYAFEQLELNEVVSFTTQSNVKSRRVMERLGMKNTGRNFKYPDVPADHPLSEHVLYSISNTQWQVGTL